MKIAVWKTGHPIADTVADYLRKGFNGDTFKTGERFPSDYEVHTAYGILRGTDRVFMQADKFLHWDRGFFRPRHYDGYYRVAYNGTQQISNWPEPDYDRLERLGLAIAPWRGFSPDKPVLVIPPTEAVSDFFKIKWGHPRLKSYVVRQKGDPSAINFQDYNYVLTFNSSVGWQALQAGIPCLSDPTHSMVGSWFHNISLDDLSEKQYVDRKKLFATMASLQFTLSEIEQGAAWPLMCMLVGTVEKQSAPMSPATP